MPFWSSFPLAPELRFLDHRLSSYPREEPEGRKKKKKKTELRAMADIEMGSKRERREEESDDFTEYQPINWKRVFFAPKYLRASTTRCLCQLRSKNH